MNGYVVVEWNQASRRPSLACDDVHDTEPEAQECAAWFRERDATTGRREQYTVHELGEQMNVKVDTDEH